MKLAASNKALATLAKEQNFEQHVCKLFGQRDAFKNPLMNTETKQIWARWHALNKDGGLRRADSTARVLWIVGLVLFLFVIFALIYSLHPALVTVAAAVMGWVIAERNALRTRSAQWPIFKSYIDWKLVQKDLNYDNKGDALDDDIPNLLKRPLS